MAKQGVTGSCPKCGALVRPGAEGPGSYVCRKCGPIAGPVGAPPEQPGILPRRGPHGPVPPSFASISPFTVASRTDTGSVWAQQPTQATSNGRAGATLDERAAPVPGPAARTSKGQTPPLAGKPTGEAAQPPTLEDSEKGTSKGVSMLDAALILNDEDEDLALQQVHRWQRKRGAKPPHIGFDPEHAQRKLYAPSALAAWIEKIEVALVLSKHQLRQRLIRKARAPR